MRFVFLIMGSFDGRFDRAEIVGGNARIIGVSNLAEACEIAGSLRGETDCIELCGAFGQEGARRVIEATGGKLPVGYVVHLPEQDELYRQIFG